MNVRFTAGVLCLAMCIAALSGCSVQNQTASGDHTSDSVSQTQTQVVENTTSQGEAEDMYSGNHLSPDYTQELDQKEYKLLSNDLQYDINWGDGVKITSVYDKAIEHEYLTKTFSVFGYLLRDNLVVGGYDSKGPFSSSKDEVTGAYTDQSGEKLTLEVQSTQADDLAFTVILQAAEGQIDVQITVHNNSGEEKIVYLNYPSFSRLSIPGEENRASVMLPSEIGWVGPYDTDSSYGNTCAVDKAVMPTGYNVMQVAAIYNADKKGGIYFFDKNGAVMSDTPESALFVSGQTVMGRWAKQIGANSSAVSSTITTGLIHDDDWHTAIDAYMVFKSGTLANEEGTPDWLREAGAIYSSRREGSGGTFQALQEKSNLAERIDSFNNMDQLLDEAESYGSDVVLLVDYYEPADTTGVDSALAASIKRRPYWNKGDYIIRTDLGGEEAFINGIKKIHERGGKVIVYFEPFIVFQYSGIGRTLGFSWGAHNVTGALDDSYSLCYTMIGAFQSWQDYCVKTCENLVSKYDVDGIFLDSLGWQWNKLYYTQSEMQIYSYEKYNQGLIELNNRIRDSVRTIKSDAVVISESAGGPLPAYNDGGWAAQNVWGNTTKAGAILASPVRYASPDVNFITNGNDINELNQVFAAGCSLAVCDYWDSDKDYIKQLVEIRKKYCDAMVHGSQEQLNTAEEKVIAYEYTGEKDVVIPVVNAGAGDYSGKIKLADYAGKSIVELLSGNSYSVDSDGYLNVSVGAGKLLVFQAEID